MACSSCNGQGDCGCVSNYKTLDLGTHHIWTLGGAGVPGLVDVIVSETGTEDIAPTIGGLQYSITVERATSLFRCKVYFELSTDGLSWADKTYIDGVWRNGNVVETSAWKTDVANYKRKIRFGVEADQGPSNQVGLEQALVSLVIGSLVK